MAETFVFAAPKPEPMWGFFGLAGDTGCGKTWSALRLMRGLIGSDDFAVIDTEQGRASHYHVSRLGKRGFDFVSARLDAPYTPQRYLAAAQAAVKLGVKGLIIDSGSHLWESEGGIQDRADRLAKELAQKWNTSIDKTQFGAWREPKADMWKLIWFLDQAPIHVIMCMRAKPKKKPLKGTNGKTEIVDLGYQPIIEHSVPFQFQFCALFEPERPGVPRWHVKPLAEQFKGWLDKDEPMNEEQGRKLAVWLAGPQATQKAAADELASEPKRTNGKTKTLALHYSGKVIEEHASGATWLVAFKRGWRDDRRGMGEQGNLTILEWLLKKAPDEASRAELDKLALDLREDLDAEQGRRKSRPDDGEPEFDGFDQADGEPVSEAA